MKLEAPFSWFGGKREAADLIWERFGNVPNYVDPFCGSLAVPLRRPHAPKIETVNDADGLLVNFWRAVAHAPEAVAEAADWPVSEADLHPRHFQLVEARESLTERLMGDPEYFCPRLAGWWVWGHSCWIGSDWCSGQGPWVLREGRLASQSKEPGQPKELRQGREPGVSRRLPKLSGGGGGVHRKLPNLSSGGRGVQRTRHSTRSDEPSESRLDEASEVPRAGIERWLRTLARRLRGIRITCGDWRRVVTPAVTYHNGLTGILLDPPYDNSSIQYAGGGDGVAQEVAAWAREQGHREDLRIALCGLVGDYEMPGWDAVRWHARGGYANQGASAGENNRKREVIWFSPSCLKAQQSQLDFSPAEAPCST